MTGVCGGGAEPNGPIYGETKGLEWSKLLLVFCMCMESIWCIESILKSDWRIVILFSNRMDGKKLKLGRWCSGMPSARLRTVLHSERQRLGESVALASKRLGWVGSAKADYEVD